MTDMVRAIAVGVAIVASSYLLARVTMLDADAAKPTPTVEIPAGLLPIRSCKIHDLDTLVNCEIVLPWDVVLVNQSIRLHGVDALEVSKTRQTVEVTADEIARGRQGLSKLDAMASGGTWYVKPTGDSVYGRREGLLYLRRSSGGWIDLAEWVRANGYERAAQ